MCEWKRLGVGRESNVEMGPVGLAQGGLEQGGHAQGGLEQGGHAQGGQSGGRVETLACGEVAGSLKARVGESSGDMVGML